MDISFTFHAYHRVEDRLSLTHVDIVNIINDGLTINIGTEEGTNRDHLLFYSKPDDRCFVVILDTKSKTIITILPIDYHSNISWAVSIDSQTQAKNISVGGVDDTTEPTNVNDIINTNATVFRISGLVTDEYGRYLKMISLGSYPCIPYNYRIEKLVKDLDFIEYLRRRLLKIKDDVQFDGYISNIYIRIGKNGQPASFLTYEILQNA